MDRIDTLYLENYKKMRVYTCPKCHGIDSYCECWQGLRLEIKKIKANIPTMYRDFSFEKFTHPQLKAQKAKLKEYCDDVKNLRFSGKSIYLYGSKGLAKTASAQLILSHALANNYTGRYISSLTVFLDQMQSSWNNKDDSTNYEQIITNTDFLVIDNVGEGIIKTELMTAKLRRLFQLRAGSMLPTIFISPIDTSSLTDTNEIYIINLFKHNLTQLEFKGFDFVENVIKKLPKKDQ